jgi:hypothetical protein
MATELYLQVEVVGCPTVCRHCWAQGMPYQAMPAEDVAWVLEQAHRFCDNHGLGFGAYPMHEVAAHPEAAEILRLFADHVGAAEFEPLATTGVPLAIRDDWQQLLAAAATLGTTTMWVAFHGIGSEHDRQVNRPGAYAETCLAIQRACGGAAGRLQRLPHQHQRAAGRATAWGAAAVGGRWDGLGARDLLPHSPVPPQRAPAPSAVGTAPDRRPRPPAQPVPRWRLGEP